MQPYHDPIDRFKLSFRLMALAVISLPLVPAFSFYPGHLQPLKEGILHICSISALLFLLRRGIREEEYLGHSLILLFLGEIFLSSLLSLDRPRSFYQLENWLSFFAAYLFMTKASLEEGTLLWACSSAAGGIAALLLVIQHFHPIRSNLFFLSLWTNPIEPWSFVILTLPISLGLYFSGERALVRVCALWSVFLGGFLLLTVPPPPVMTDSWKSSLAVMAKRPWIGSGPGTFPLAFQGSHHRHPLPGDPGHLPENAHNQFLNLGVELGGSGLILFGLLVVLALRNGLAFLKSTSQNQRRFALGLLVSAFLYLGLAFFYDRRPATAFLFWLVLGFLTALPCEQKEESFPVPQLTLRFLLVILPVSMIFFVAHEVKLITADYSYGKAQRTALSDSQTTVQLLENAIRLNPGMTVHAVTLADYYNAMAQSSSNARPDEQAAVQVLEEAIRRHPNEALLYSKLGETYSHIQDEPDTTRKAFLAYDKALSLDPENPLYLNRRGLAYFHLGKLAEAEEDLKHALSLFPQYEEPRQYLELMRKEKQLRPRPR